MGDARALHKEIAVSWILNARDRWKSNENQDFPRSEQPGLRALWSGHSTEGTSGGMPLRLEEFASCACGSDRLAVMATGSEMMCLSYPPGGRSLETTVERLGWWGWREASRHGLEQLLAARGSASESHSSGDSAVGGPAGWGLRPEHSVETQWKFDGQLLGSRA